MANKILLFGSTGLIGGILSDQLNLIQVPRNECDLRSASQVKSILNEHKPDVVINCAGDVYKTDKCLEDNVTIHENFVSNSKNFGKIINFGSGAEFDRSKSIDKAKEEHIFQSYPKDPYGLAKNSIARDSYLVENFYTLRLFGLFTKKDKGRFFSKISDPTFRFEDRYFDYFSAEDLVTVVKYFCDNDPKFRDVNLVYKDKYRLSDYAYTIYAYNKNKSLLHFDRVDRNYTGCHERLYDLDIPLIGLGNELRNFKL